MPDTDSDLLSRAIAAAKPYLKFGEAESATNLEMAITAALETARAGAGAELDAARTEWFRAVDHLRSFAETHNDDRTTETEAIFYLAERARAERPAPPPAVFLFTEAMVREVIDLTWGDAFEDQSVPETRIQDRIIAKALRNAGAGDLDQLLYGRMREMAFAKKDRSQILARFLPDLEARYGGDMGRLKMFEGRFAVVQHEGFTVSGHDIGWSMRGHGGFPDEWFTGWWPLPGAAVRPASQALAEPVARIEALEAVVQRFVAANDEAPEFGVADCVDNKGEHYQSADYAALIIDARALLSGSTPKPAGGPDMSMLSDYQRHVSEPLEASLRATIAALLARVAELEAKPAGVEITEEMVERARRYLRHGNLETAEAIEYALKSIFDPPAALTTQTKEAGQ